ncbi:MAG TPA: Rho termination factor N-terminal domain-containing protein [Mycobacteriales bacterium]|jgi:hypothetical protein
MAENEDELREKTVDELRDMARDAGVSGVSDMRKDDLVRALASGDSGGSSDGGGVRTGPGTSRSVQYSQEVTSTGEEPERPGRSLVTTDHEVIERWAEERGATPATVEGTEHGDHLGVLTFDFGGGEEGNLRHVGWDEWFRTFDERRLNFVYQEQRSDGKQSNFFRLESPEREDA